MNKRALVVGSVAFDVMFDMHGTIREKIVLKKGKLGRQNLMFTAKIKQQHFGGTGGNISYGLGLLGVGPILFSTAGQDFVPIFKRHLEKHGVDVRVSVDSRNWTASFYGMSDEAKEQIGVWQPNAYGQLGFVSIVKELGRESLKDVSVAIFSGAPSVVYRHMKDVRAVGSTRTCVIFDPGKMVATSRDAKFVRLGLAISDIFIVNDVELYQISKLLGQPVEEILGLGPRAVIETKGGEGSVLYEPGRTTRIPVVKPRRVVEVTGAGDAYRAGLMYGILKGVDLPAACRIGAYLGARKVETVGGQNYTLSAGDIRKFSLS